MFPFVFDKTGNFKINTNNLNENMQVRMYFIGGIICADRIPPGPDVIVGVFQPTLLNPGSVHPGSSNLKKEE
jgi:hypothetical protein